MQLAADKKGLLGNGQTGAVSAVGEMLRRRFFNSALSVLCRKERERENVSSD